MEESERPRIDEKSFYTIPDLMKALRCSDKHITNLRKSNRIPQPLKIGELVRWPRQTIEKWIDDGCPALAV